MSVPFGAEQLIDRCSFGMPRIAAPSSIGSETHTPALKRLTVGSQTIGGTPVSAVQPLVSRATPADAVVSVPVHMLRDQLGSTESADSGPVPSHHRTSPMLKRLVDPVTCAQSGYDSTAGLSRRRSTTGGSASMPVGAPARYWSNHRVALLHTWFGSPIRPVPSATTWSPGASSSRFGPVSLARKSTSWLGANRLSPYEFAIMIAG